MERIRRFLRDSSCDRTEIIPWIHRSIPDSQLFGISETDYKKERSLSEAKSGIQSLAETKGDRITGSCDFSRSQFCILPDQQQAVYSDGTWQAHPDPNGDGKDSVHQPGRDKAGGCESRESSPYLLHSRQKIYGGVRSGDSELCESERGCVSLPEQRVCSDRTFSK